MSNGVLQVLLIEDLDADAVLTERMLRRNGVCEIRVVRVRSMKEAIEYQQENDSDIALLDLHLPDSDGIESLHRLQAVDARLPIVLLTGSEDHELALAAIANGAQDFVSKQAVIPSQLVRTLLFAKTRQSKMLGWKAAAEIDVLTGVNNRRRLLKRFDEENSVRVGGDTVNLALLDVDNFKAFNDQHGHLCGDAILAEIGVILNEEFTGADDAFRYGGEEFVILMRKQSFQAAEDQINALLSRIENSFVLISDKRLGVTVSAGVVEVEREESFETVFARCDAALYQAKAKGRNQTIALHAS